VCKAYKLVFFSGRGVLPYLFFFFFVLFYLASLLVSTLLYLARVLESAVNSLVLPLSLPRYIFGVIIAQRMQRMAANVLFLLNKI